MPDSKYSTFSYRFENGGLQARYVYDKPPQGTYRNLENLECRVENALSTRYGWQALTQNGTVNQPLPTAAHSLSKLNSLSAMYRYAGAGTSLLRSPVPTSFASIASGLSGSRLSMYPYRPEGNANPYMFIADKAKLLKDNGTGNAQNWGVGAPTRPVRTQIGDPAKVIVETFDEANTSSFTFAGYTGPQIVERVQGTLQPTGTTIGLVEFDELKPTVVNNGLVRAANVTTVTTVAPHGWITGMRISVQNPLDTSFNVTSATITVTGANTFTYANPGPNATSGSSSTINGTILSAVPSLYEGMLLEIDSGGNPETVLIITIIKNVGFTANQTQPHTSNMPYTASCLQGNVAANTTATITKQGKFNFQTNSQSFGIPYSIQAISRTSNSVLMQLGPTGGAGTPLNPFTWPALKVGDSIAISGVSDATFNGLPFVITSIFIEAPAFFVRYQQIGPDSSGVVGSGQVTKVNSLRLSADDNDYFSIFFNADDPFSITEIRLLFDVGDGSFTKDYYYKSISSSTAQPAVAGNLTNGDVLTKQVFDRASGLTDNRLLGIQSTDLLPTDLQSLRWLRPAILNTGKNAWSVVQMMRGEFVQVGAAGGPNNTWADVVAWRIQITTQPNVGVQLSVDDLVFIAGSGLDAFGNEPYDYRITLYNINTGLETNPSVTQTSSIFISPRRQPVLVSFNQTQGTDPQITHWRIYRRGGTLTQAWYRVDTVPIANTQYLDIQSDSDIELNPQLQIDNDAPVTSVMRTPLNATIATVIQPAVPGFATLTLNTVVTNAFIGQLVSVGVGDDQEFAYLENVTTIAGVTNLQLWLQNTHLAGEIVNATQRQQVPMNLMAIAFDKAWLAGDPDNPHILYFSKTFSPETFPQQNFLEVGTPDAPIMALIAHRGILYVATTKTWYQVLGAGSATPTIIPTGVKHGLTGNFAWAASEGIIYYESYDGIYAFTGSFSEYMTEPVEWIFTAKNLGPVVAEDGTQKANTVMAYANHELFVSYIDTGSRRRRMIYHDVYRRWRNDDSSRADINAMNFEEDTGTFVIGGTDAMVYQDRVGDFDWGNLVGGILTPSAIPFTLQTSQMDQDVPKAFKVYNELTLDMDTNGQTVAISLLFDNGATVVPVGTFTGTGRKQYQININAGDGQRSQNVGLLITGSVTAAITFFEVHIRALVEAEFRKSFDSYWSRYGSDEWKFIKQGWFEYAAPDAAGISFLVFVEGNMNAPAFSFTLPQSVARRTERIRFPATKATMFRFVATSASDFQLYDESQIEMKSLGVQKGYSRQKLAA